MQHSDTKIFQRFIDSAWQVLERANDHHIYLAASGIAFNIILFSLPTVLVIVFVLGALVEPAIVIGAVEQFFRQTLPDGGGLEAILREANNELQEVLTNYSNAGWFGIPVLLWISLALFSSVRTALSAVFSQRERGSWLRYILKDFFLLAMFIVSILIVNIFPSAFALLMRGIVQVAPSLDGDILRAVAPRVVAMLMLFFFFFCLYRFAPNQRPPAAITVMSAMLCAVCWECARVGFGWYLQHLASFGRMYGIYATVAASALWVYYSALVMLFSAEIARYWYERRRHVMMNEASEKGFMQSTTSKLK